MKQEKPPFKVLDYIVRIKWQKRGYPHAHILLWADLPDVAGKHRPEDAAAAADVDGSDGEVCDASAPVCVEDLSDNKVRSLLERRCQGRSQDVRCHGQTDMGDRYFRQI